MARVGPATVVSVQALQARFVENGAGTYIADFVLPQGATLIDIVVVGEALWTAATSAVLDIGDVALPQGWIAALNVKATDLLATESIALGSTQVRGGTTGAYTVIGTSTHIQRGDTDAERTITAKITSVGAGTAGRTKVTVLYSVGQPTVITQ